MQLICRIAADSGVGADTQLGRCIAVNGVYRFNNLYLRHGGTSFGFSIFMCDSSLRGGGKLFSVPILAISALCFRHFPTRLCHFFRHDHTFESGFSVTGDPDHKQWTVPAAARPDRTAAAHPIVHPHGTMAVDPDPDRAYLAVMSKPAERGVWPHLVAAGGGGSWLWCAGGARLRPLGLLRDHGIFRNPERGDCGVLLGRP